MRTCTAMSNSLSCAATEGQQPRDAYAHIDDCARMRAGIEEVAGEGRGGVGVLDGNTGQGQMSGRGIGCITCALVTLW